MNKKEAIFVSPHKGGWSVKTAGKSKASKVCESQKEAIEIAIEQAKNAKTELVIQGRDGKIREKNSYGNDPCPPKDKN